MTTVILTIVFIAPNALGSAQLLLDAAKRGDARQLAAQLSNGADPEATNWGGGYSTLIGS